MYLNGQGHMTKMATTPIYHPAGDVLWVFVEPGNVVP